MRCRFEGDHFVGTILIFPVLTGLAFAFAAICRPGTLRICVSSDPICMIVPGIISYVFQIPSINLHHPFLLPKSEKVPLFIIHISWAKHNNFDFPL